MVIAPPAVGIEGVAGEFPSVRQQIVAARGLRRDAQGPAGPGDHAQLAGQVVVFFVDQEGEIQIPQIVEHRPSAGETAGQKPAVRLQLGGAALPPGVLVAANHHRMAVLP